MIHWENLKEYLVGFKNRSGLHLFSTTMLERLSNFLLSSILILFLSKADLGDISYAQSFMSVFLAIVGLGVNSALLQMGSQLQSQSERNKLFSYTFINGLWATLGLILLSLIISGIVSFNNWVILSYLILLSIRMIPEFLKNTLMNWFRMNFLNRNLFSFEWINTLVQFSLSVLLLALGGIYGYLAALIIAPIVVFAFYAKNLPLGKNFRWQSEVADKKYFWKFSIQSSFANLVSQMLFMVDAIVIFHFLGNEANAEYRVASIIPFNLLFIPTVFMKTDYALLAKNANNKTFLLQYFRNYFILFLLVTSLIFFAGYFFGEWFLGFFGDKYHPFSMFLILLVAACISILTRVPLGNTISAIGKSAMVMYISIITLLLDIVLNIILINKMGLIGAAYATAISLIISGLMCFVYFLYYLYNLPANDD